MSTMNKTKLSPPWIEYVNKIRSLFEKDPEISIKFDEPVMNLRIYVDNSDKYDALTRLLPEEKVFGGAALMITVIPANKDEHKDNRYYLKKLFQGNKAVTAIEDMTGIASNPMTFIVFEKKVIQYWSDNLGDINGMKSTLMEEIARDVFENADGVFFNTNTDEPEDDYAEDCDDRPF